MMKATLIAALALMAAPLVAQTTAPTRAAAPAPAVTYIHAGHLIDRPGQPPRGPSTIVVTGDKVTAIRDGFADAPAGTTTIELRDSWVLPGLIDMHVHLWGIGGDPLRSRLEALTRDRFDSFVSATENARATLDAGFTSVRDLGGDARGIRALRDAIDRGAVAGPTIINAGQVITVTGGHGDATNGMGEQYAETVHARQINTCDGPDDCRRAVRAQVALGARVIKFAATGGVLSNVSGGLGRAMTAEEMRAIVETAHALGRKVAAHSHAAEGTRAAVEAGVDTIEHGSFLDDETIRAMKARGTWLVPTMMAPVAALAQARGGALPPATIPKAEAAGAAAMASYRRAIAAGVRVAFGTDTGVSRHGDNAQEFALMVAAGMTPAQAIRAATVSAATVLGRDDLGAIAPGMAADVIAVAGSPLEDVRRLERVGFVMHRGVVARNVLARP